MKASPRPYHHGNLRQALLSAGERAIESAGVLHLSLRELSRELGVSHTSPRRHFADKQALLDALALHGYERLGAALARAARDHGQPFNVRLTKVARAFVSFAIQHPAMLGLMFEAKHRADAPRELLEAGENAFAHIFGVFTSGQATGAVVAGDPHRLALVAFAALQGLVTLSTNGKFKGASLNVLIGEVIERIILGLRPRD